MSEIKRKNRTTNTIPARLIFACDRISSVMLNVLRNRQSDIVTLSEGLHDVVIRWSEVGIGLRSTIMKDDLPSYIEEVPESVDPHYADVKGRRVISQMVLTLPAY